MKTKTTFVIDACALINAAHQYNMSKAAFAPIWGKFDTMIKNGDIVIGSSGNTVLLEGTDAKFQQAVLCISAKLGGFVYDRNLGSKVLLQNKTLSAKQTELLANESLAKMKNTYASVKSVGRQITIDLTVDDITREVQINGNL